MPERQWKRRKKLPQPGFQLRLVGAFAGLCVLALVAQTFVLGAQLMRFSGTMPSGGGHLAGELTELLSRTLAISLVLVLPALLVIGVFVTFRIAGPLFRFERHLEAVARGEWPGPCRIRSKDDLQDLCRLLNEGLEGARALGAAEGRAADGEDEEERDVA